MIEKLVIYPDNMLANMNKFRGLVMSQRVLLALTQAGVSREDAYRLVQRNAMKVWEQGKDFKTELLGDEDVSSRSEYASKLLKNLISTITPNMWTRFSRGCLATVDPLAATNCDIPVWPHQCDETGTATRYCPKSIKFYGNLFWGNPTLR